MTASEKRLRQFFGGYFHQDWDVEGADTWEAVIDCYLREHAAGDARLLSEDLRAWLDGNDGDAMVGRQLVADLWCDFDPTPLGLTDRAWIEAIISRVDRFVGEPA